MISTLVACGEEKKKEVPPAPSCELLATRMIDAKMVPAKAKDDVVKMCTADLKTSAGLKAMVACSAKTGSDFETCADAANTLIEKEEAEAEAAKTVAAIEADIAAKKIVDSEHRYTCTNIDDDTPEATKAACKKYIDEGLTIIAAKLTEERDAYKGDTGSICAVYLEDMLKAAGDPADKKAMFETLCKEVDYSSGIAGTIEDIDKELKKDKDVSYPYHCWGEDDKQPAELMKMGTEWSKATAQKIAERCVLEVAKKMLPVEFAEKIRICYPAMERAHKLHTAFKLAGKDADLDKLIEQAKVDPECKGK